MQITISQKQIDAAIEQYVYDNVTVDDGKRVDVGMVATRGQDGFHAIIRIVDKDAPASVFKKQPVTKPTTGDTLNDKFANAAANGEDGAPKKRGRPAGSKNKTTATTETTDPVEKVLTPADTGDAKLDNMIEASVNQDNSVQATQQVSDVAADLAHDPVPEVAEVAAEKAPTLNENSDISTQASETLAANLSDGEVAEPVLAEHEPAVQEAVADATDQTVEQVQEAQAADPVPEASQEQEGEVATPVEEEAAPAPTRSLFGNLGNRPQN